MARKVTTVYECDRCGQRVDAMSDLQRFALEQIRRGRKGNRIVTVDLCGDCEPDLLAAVEPFFATEGLPELHAMRRDEA